MKTLRILTLALLAAGCPGETKLVLPEAPQIDKFTATPASVAKGGMVTLEWASRNGEVEILDVAANAPVAGVDKATHSGSVMVKVDAQTVFVLNVTNSRGVKVTASASVQLEGAGQQVLFAALPTTIASGASSTLVWNAPGAHGLTITPMGGTRLDLNGQLETGSLEVKPASSTVYTLDADGTTKTVTVTVGQALVSFTASKSLASAGEMVTLSWKTLNATKVTVSQPGKGVLVTETDAAKVADGSATDTLAAYADGSVVPYVISVEGARPALSQTVNVVVGKLPAVVSFTGPAFAKLGANFTLSWTTQNADSVELSRGGTVFYRSLSAAEAAAGSLQLPTPAMRTDYTLTAVNTRAGTRATKTLTQDVVGPASVTTFTALPATVPTGGTAVTLTWNVPNARHVRITDSDGVTVASARGATAETGTQLAYPNGNTTYSLTADNTLDPAVTATAMVTVTTPAAFGASGALFAGIPFDLSWSVGGPAPVQGVYGPANVVLNGSSTGFVDISTTGTKLNFSSADDATLAFTPPDFETFLWGTRVSGAFTASTNGFIALVPSASSRATTLALPNATVERNFLAAYWADLALAGGAVYWQVINEAPERTLVVQYDHVTAKAAAGSDLVFEIKVHQSGQVTYEYKQLNGSVMPVVGVQGAANVALVGPLPTAGSSLTFAGPLTSPITTSLQAADPISGFIKLTNGYLHVKFTPTTFVAPGQLGISEAMYSPNPAIATTGEWFEVSNRSAATIDLAGWTVDFGGSVLVIDAGLPLAPGASVILGQTEQDAGNDNVATNFVYGPQLSMADNAGTLALFLGPYRSTVSWNAADGGSGGVGVSVQGDPQNHLVSTDTSTTPPHGITCASKTPFGTQSPQQQGSPGTFASCIMKLSSIPVSYLNIADAGTPLFTSFDSTIANVDISSAPFPYQGAPVTSLSVSTNGFVALKPTTAVGTANKSVPSTTAPTGSVLAIFWDDLDSPDDGPISNVFSKRVAAGEDPANPGAHWIIQWHHYTHWLESPVDDLNFQVKLFDTGVIEYHYGSMTSGSSNNYAAGTSASVWLEAPSGLAALTLGVNKAVIAPNTAYRFTP
ncbi:MAG: lamin tail domain-containing protein [Archangiaceae bacterium]|nr:lamin tail domain-containing protein [Archangiaceae bacterium]